MAKVAKHEENQKWQLLLVKVAVIVAHIFAKLMSYEFCLLSCSQAHFVQVLTKGFMRSELLRV